jgi:hypothetical protein
MVLKSIVTLVRRRNHLDAVANQQTIKDEDPSRQNRYGIALHKLLINHRINLEMRGSILRSFASSDIVHNDGDSDRGRGVLPRHLGWLLWQGLY